MRVGDKIFLKTVYEEVIVRKFDDVRQIAIVSYKLKPKQNWEVAYSDIEKKKQKIKTKTIHNDAQKNILKELGLTHLIK